MAKTCIERAREGLTTGDQGAPSPASISMVVFIFFLLGLVIDVSLHDLLYITNLDENVLGFQIGVDNAALPVKVIETEQDLLRDLFDQRHWNASVVPALDETEQIFTQDFKDHADVDTIGALVIERVQEAHDMSPSWVFHVCLDYLVEKPNLVECGFCVVRRGSDDFESDVFACCVVLGQPDGREMSPA